jgi:hypothetical protein
MLMVEPILREVLLGEMKVEKIPTQKETRVEMKVQLVMMKV